MDKYEIVSYTLLGTIAVIYLVAMIMGMIAMFPFGLIGLIILLGIGILLLKVLKERMENKEDDYYSKEIEK